MTFFYANILKIPWYIWVILKRVLVCNLPGTYNMCYHSSQSIYGHLWGRDSHERQPNGLSVTPQLKCQMLYIRELSTIMAGGGGWKRGPWNILENLGESKIFWRFTGAMRKHFGIFYLKNVCQYYSGHNKFLCIWEGAMTFFYMFEGAVNIFYHHKTFQPTPCRNCWQLPYNHITFVNNIYFRYLWKFYSYSDQMCIVMSSILHWDVT